MSKFFDDTMQGLLEAVAIKNEKEKEIVKQEWIRLGYSKEQTEELSRLAEIYIATASFDNINEIVDTVVNKLCESTGYVVTAEELAEILEKEDRLC